MDKNHLRNLIIGILGIPLFALLSVVIAGTIFNFAEWQIILAIFLTLISIFICQVKYFENKHQLKVEKCQKS
jgi:ABC-type antimicrobial peptide transport system permease subunit